MPKKLILVVDDEEDILHFLQMVLREKGYEVRAASGGKEALAQVQQERPDLILLDIMMPQMDGWEVLRRLKARATTAGILVALLSARSGARDRAQGTREGAAEYICKPFALEELLGKIASLLGAEGTPPIGT